MAQMDTSSSSSSSSSASGSSTSSTSESDTFSCTFTSIANSDVDNIVLRSCGTASISLAIAVPKYAFIVSTLDAEHAAEILNDPECTCGVRPLTILSAMKPNLAAQIMIFMDGSMVSDIVKNMDIRALCSILYTGSERCVAEISQKVDLLALSSCIAKLLRGFDNVILDILKKISLTRVLEVFEKLPVAVFGKCASLVHCDAFTLSLLEKLSIGRAFTLFSGMNVVQARKLFGQLFGMHCARAIELFKVFINTEGHQQACVKLITSLPIDEAAQLIAVSDSSALELLTLMDDQAADSILHRMCVIHREALPMSILKYVGQWGPERLTRFLHWGDGDSKLTILKTLPYSKATQVIRLIGVDDAVAMVERLVCILSRALTSDDANDANMSIFRELLLKIEQADRCCRSRDHFKTSNAIMRASQILDTMSSITISKVLQDMEAVAIASFIERMSLARARQALRAIDSEILANAILDELSMQKATLIQFTSLRVGLKRHFSIDSERVDREHKRRR